MSIDLTFFVNEAWITLYTCFKSDIMNTLKAATQDALQTQFHLNLQGSHYIDERPTVLWIAGRELIL